MPKNNFGKSVVFIFRILKASQQSAAKFMPRHRDDNTVRNNFDLTMMAFILRTLVKMIFALYFKQKKKTLAYFKDNNPDSAYDHLPQDLWRNNYPVVLVHGFFGWAPDESPLFGDYWKYVSDSGVAANHTIYQADIAPLGSIHDRACELYQQLVGIFQLQEECKIEDANSVEMAAQVYGKEHFDCDHKQQTFYRVHYLRQVQRKAKKIYAFPDGIPGGWSKTNKIHFICHSQGSQTVRYLQYLMSIDYFNKDTDAIKQDKSDWFASITSMLGCLNGNMTSGSFGCNLKHNRLIGLEEEGEKDFMNFFNPKGTKTAALLLNLIAQEGTNDRQLENVKRIITTDANDKKSVVFELGAQNLPVIEFDSQTGGLNRRPNESMGDYVRRLYLEVDQLYGTDFAQSEFMMANYYHHNSKIKTYGHTYYFALSAGEQKKFMHKQREIMKQPQKTIDQSLGFDSDVRQNLNLYGTTQKHSARNENNLTSLDFIDNFFKVSTNLISVYCRLWTDCFTFYEPVDHLDNLKNSSMNNLSAIDYANRDLTEDSDGVLPRWSEEYPRLSSNYLSKADVENRPWGQKSRPVYVDYKVDNMMLQEAETYETGVWYFSSIAGTDHHEYCGLESPFKLHRALIGREFRPQMFINILNRLRQLEYADESFRSNPRLQARINQKLSKELD